MKQSKQTDKLRFMQPLILELKTDGQTTFPQVGIYAKQTDFGIKVRKTDGKSYVSFHPSY